MLIRSFQQHTVNSTKSSVQHRLQNREEVEGAGDQKTEAWEGLALHPGDSGFGTQVQHRLKNMEEVGKAGDKMIGAWEGLALHPGGFRPWDTTATPTAR